MKIINLERSHKKTVILEAKEVILQGKLIIYPTETCYGAGVDATNPKAVNRLLQYKGGRKGKPISIAVADQKMAYQYVKTNPTAENIFNKLLPGPITIVCQGRHKVDPRIESANGTLGIRIPDYPLILEIIKNLGKPITATSANISSGKTPYSIKDILKNIPQSRTKLIDLVIDAGKLPFNPPSVVIDTTQDQPEIIRQGKIDFSKFKTISIISNSEKETRELAKNLLEQNLHLLKNSCLIFALQGELGTGKTQFTKGIGQTLGIKKTITSPTFTFVHEYPFALNEFKGKLYHLDTWRIQSPKEFLQLGITTMLKPKTVIVVEWIEKGRKILERVIANKPVKIIWLGFEHLGENQRRITFTK